MKNSTIIIGFLMAMSLTLNSCGALVKSKAKKYASVEEGAIPSNFGENNSTVLFVTKGKKSYDKYLKSNIRKVYLGKYELVAKSEIDSDEYSDTSTYRYIFDFNKVFYSYNSNNQAIYGPSAKTGIKNATGQVRRFTITDRIDGKEYVMPMTSSYWSKLQRMYIKNMEEVRAKNNGIALVR